MNIDHENLRIFGESKGIKQYQLRKNTNERNNKIKQNLIEFENFLRMKKYNENHQLLTYNLTDFRQVNSLKRIPLNPLSLRQKFGKFWKNEYIANYKKATQYNPNNLFYQLKKQIDDSTKPFKNFKIFRNFKNTLMKSSIPKYKIQKSQFSKETHKEMHFGNIFITRQNSVTTIKHKRMLTHDDPLTIQNTKSKIICSKPILNIKI